MAIAILRRAAPGFAAFGSALGQSSRRLAVEQRGVRAAARAAGALRANSAGGVRQMRGMVPAARLGGQGLVGFGRRGAAAKPLVDRGRSKLRAVNREIKKLRGSATTGASLAAVGGKSAGVTGRLGGVLGRVTRVGAGVMKLVNTAMKANPWGFVLGLLTPLIGYLVDTALQSRTAQKVMQRVMAAASKGFRALARAVLPVVRAVGRIAAGYVRGYLKVVTTVVKGIAAAVRGPMAAMRGAVSGALRLLRSFARSAMNALRRVLRLARAWLIDKPAKGFGKAKQALRGFLDGIGSLLARGMQTAAKVLRGPVVAVIGFANWVIGILNKIPRVNISRIPELAAGGVVPARRGGAPALVGEGGEAEAVLPLSALRALLDATARGAAGHAYGASGGYGASGAYGAFAYASVEHYAEPGELGALGVAEDLLFLARRAAGVPVPVPVPVPLPR
ncbi:hypothetical protein [Streptomyces boncukensis]|uniref:Tape-measure protein n=1 Tax=Streptomyces boncukensis TaxID=2711219 RepID=A0A6G4X2Q7_9ACTN|nr:hypothetical protein [Streptomyces boncukensis]NGO71137.1 hypothetical protein [Streptomyces boncukensis]